MNVVALGPPDATPPTAATGDGEPFEPAALTRVSERLLALLGGAWSAPPSIEDGWDSRQDVIALRRRASALAAQVLPSGSWLWSDPRNCLTLPFWLPDVAKPVVLLVLRHPAAVAATLRAQEELPLPVGLALWERYLRDALSSVTGLPVAVVEQETLEADPDGCIERLRGDLGEVGAEVSTGALDHCVTGRTPTKGDDAAQLSTEQQELLSTARSLRSAPSFPAVDLPPVTPWAEALLEERRRRIEERTAYLDEQRRSTERNRRLQSEYERLRERHRAAASPLRKAYRHIRGRPVAPTTRRAARAAAILPVLNEQVHIEYTLRDLIAEGFEVVLIDNGSDDETAATARSFLGHGLLSIEDLPYGGTFSLPQITEASARVAAELDHDWVMLASGDEWPMSSFENETLCDRLAIADEQGYTVVNFDEFAFVAADEEDLRGRDYRREMLRYYFYEPHYPRLMRAWRRDADITLLQGHRLQGDVRLYPHDMALRHYISLGHAYICDKYLDRRFAPESLQKGMHMGRGSKLGLTSEMLRLRETPAIKRLDSWDSHIFDRSTPCEHHFWDPSWMQDPPLHG